MTFLYACCKASSGRELKSSYTEIRFVVHVVSKHKFDDFSAV